MKTPSGLTVRKSSASYIFTNDSVRISVSIGNTKIGKTVNFNLPPIVSCRKDVPCARECYAVSDMRRKPSCRNAWQGNLQALRTNPALVRDAIEYTLMAEKPNFARFHSSGDFNVDRNNPALAQKYVQMAFDIAANFPETSFLAFTKMYELDYTAAPSNFSVVLSTWANWDCSGADLSQFAGSTFVRLSDDMQAPTGAVKCAGSCESCRMCWNIRELSTPVVYFNVHGNGKHLSEAVKVEKQAIPLTDDADELEDWSEWADDKYIIHDEWDI